MQLSARACSLSPVSRQICPLPLAVIVDNASQSRWRDSLSSSGAIVSQQTRLQVTSSTERDLDVSGSPRFDRYDHHFCIRSVRLELRSKLRIDGRPPSVRAGQGESAFAIPWNRSDARAQPDVSSMPNLQHIAHEHSHQNGPHSERTRRWTRTKANSPRDIHLRAMTNRQSHAVSRRALMAHAFRNHRQICQVRPLFHQGYQPHLRCRFRPRTSVCRQRTK